MWEAYIDCPLTWYCGLILIYLELFLPMLKLSIFCYPSLQRLPQSGPLILTEEERRTLIQEGYPIPTKLPLTKAEEKSLKKVRRKIKNKVSLLGRNSQKSKYFWIWYKNIYLVRTMLLLVCLFVFWQRGKITCPWQKLAPINLAVLCELGKNAVWVWNCKACVECDNKW